MTNDKTLEEVVAEEILEFLESEDIVTTERKDKVLGLSEILSDYANNWARDNAKEWLIENAY